MKSRLSSREPVSIYDSLLLDTKSALYEEKYSSAILYSFIYLESALKTLIGMLVDKEILSKKTADRMQKLHLYQLVTVGLRLLLNKEELPDQLVEDFSEVNKMRNEIIHEAEMKVRKEDAVKADKVVGQIIDTLVNKIENIN
jgi:hypothetical protein